MEEDLDTIISELPEIFDEFTMDSFNLYIFMLTLSDLYPTAKKKFVKNKHLSDEV